MITNNEKIDLQGLFNQFNSALTSKKFRDTIEIGKSILQRDDLSSVSNFSPEGIKSHLYLNIGAAYFQLDESEEAIKNYTLSIEFDSKHSDTFYRRGVLYLAQKKYELALSDLQQSLTLDTKNTKALLKLSSLYKISNRWNDALEHCSMFLKESPNNTDILEEQAAIYTHLEKFEDAKLVYKKILEINSTNKEYISQHIENLTHLDESDFEALIKKYSKHIETLRDSSKKSHEINEQLASAYFTRSGLYEKCLLFPAAINDLNEAIKIDSKNSLYYQCRADLFIKQKKFPEAIADLTESIALSKETGKKVDLLLKRSQLFLENTKNYDKAIEDLKTVIDLDKDHRDVYSHLADIGFILVSNKKYADAIPYLDKAKETAESIKNLPEHEKKARTDILTRVDKALKVANTYLYTSNNIYHFDKLSTHEQKELLKLLTAYSGKDIIDTINKHIKKWSICGFFASTTVDMDGLTKDLNKNLSNDSTSKFKND